MLEHGALLMTILLAAAGAVPMAILSLLCLGLVRLEAARSEPEGEGARMIDKHPRNRGSGLTGGGGADGLGF